MTSSSISAKASGRRSVRSYGYGAWSEVVEERTNVGNRWVTRDALGRVETLDTVDGSTTLRWDSKPHGIGKLARAESPDGVVLEPSYDALGRETDTTWTIDRSDYTVTKGYDLFGRLATLDYPSVAGSRYRVAYGYSYGWLKTASAGSRVLWNALAREEWGPVKLALLGNGLYVRREYDADTARLEIEHLAAAASSTCFTFKRRADGGLRQARD